MSTAAEEPSSLNAMGITSHRDSEEARAKLQHFITKDEVGMVTVKDRGIKAQSE